MGMGADSDGPGGAGGGTGGDDYGWGSDYGGASGGSPDNEPGSSGFSGADQGGTSDTAMDGYGRGTVGDDPSVPSEGFQGFGDQYSYGEAFNDQLDIMRNWAGEIMSRAFGVLGAFATLIGFKGTVDPFKSYDLIQDLFYNILGGKWTSYSYKNDFTDVASLNTYGNDDMIAPEDVQKSFQAQAYNGAVRSLQAAQAAQVAQSQNAGQTTAPWQNIWSTQEPPQNITLFQTGDILMQSPYDAMNFPPPVKGNMYSQPKTSIWYI